VAYLTANPRTLDVDPDSGKLYDTRIRVDKEIRDVREAVKRAVYRDYIDISVWPAAMPVDLLNSLNDERPHVLHFSGHGDGQALEFDDGEMDDPQSADVTFEQLLPCWQQPISLCGFWCSTRATRSTVLRCCSGPYQSSSQRATASPTSPRIFLPYASTQPSPLASRFRQRFGQARAMIDMLPGESGDIVQTLVRKDVDLAEVVLVKLPQDVINEMV